MGTGGRVQLVNIVSKGAFLFWMDYYVAFLGDF